MSHKVFIDGQAGTTGLEIHRRLAMRDDLEMLHIDSAQRKSSTARRALINAADVVILCLPDDAARESVALVSDPDVKVLDASTAHRVHDDWVYGLPELAPGQREAIAAASRVSNPGCYAQGFILLVRPLIGAGLLSPAQPLSMHAISGYSGGGRQMIERYEARAQEQPTELWHARSYALDLSHKHLSEMREYARIDHTPIFSPTVGHYYRGMVVHVPIFASQLSAPATPASLTQVLAEHYSKEALVNVVAEPEALLEHGQLPPEGMNYTNGIELMVFGNEERMLLTARADNLGKGASGAAVQNLNLMLGIEELRGLLTAGE
ncbi:MAG: N-acetyl-gamma-glutamyl-phosphate reductase [Gammaproteobacteria bacterium]|nr:N-acetyl-gamma-glutamyl-phosphate reductase [Gammaproteobacteria bacterium]